VVAGVEHAVGGIVGNADIGSGGTGSQRGREWWVGSDGSGIFKESEGRLAIRGSGGRGRGLWALFRRARRMCGLRCRSASLAVKKVESSPSSEEAHVDELKDVCKDDAVVDHDRSPRRLEEDEDEDRLSSSSMVYILLSELRLELAGRGPCRQLPVRRRDIVGVGETKLYVKDLALKHKSGTEAIKVDEYIRSKCRNRRSIERGNRANCPETVFHTMV